MIIFFIVFFLYLFSLFGYLLIEINLKFGKQGSYMLITIALLSGLLLFLSFMYIKKNKEWKKTIEKYSHIASLEKQEEETSIIISNKTKELHEYNSQLEIIKKDLEAYEEEQGVILSGFYEFKYNFNNSDEYRIRLNIIRDKQKQLIKEEKALVSTTEWTVDGSKTEGKKFQKRNTKLGLAAFNVQCDNEVLKVNYSNIQKAIDRIHKIKENINKLIEANHCYISNDFFDLKIQELELVHEYQEMLQEEKEEQRLIKEQMREEEKALREAQKAREESEKEEKMYLKALAKAESDLEKAHEENKAELGNQLRIIHEKLAEAQEKTKRAISMAELTKQGHVYIISNIGSFGDNIYKIGMTRRFDPIDRVKELGSASVPFEFDIHAMIFSKDCPFLEKQLHSFFKNKRVNQMNDRKEFFNVSIDEIENAIIELLPDGKIDFTKKAEAKAYHQTIAKLRLNQSELQNK